MQEFIEWLEEKYLEYDEKSEEFKARKGAELPCPLEFLVALWEMADKHIDETNRELVYKEDFEKHYHASEQVVKHTVKTA